MKKLRVIQWTTGKVGKHSLRAILEDPRLELAGVFAYSDDKAGVDAGELCGLPPCGVAATNDVAALLNLGADAVIYTPFMADLGHVVALLESGHDVISTNLFLNVGGIRSGAGEQLAAACERGGSSLHITGVNPGWVNGVAVALTATCRRVECVSLFESADCSGYQSAETWQAMGMSMPEATDTLMESAQAWMMSFADATQKMADALQFRLDDLRFSVEFAKTSRTVDLGWFCMPENTIGAVRGGWDGVVNGQTVVQTRVAWYLTKHLQVDWQFDDDHYHLVVQGDPGIDTRIRFQPPPGWGPADWEILTALPAVNALFAVADARPGILGLGDTPLICAPAGVWAGR